MDRGVWWATGHGVTESDTTERLSTHSTAAATQVCEALSNSFHPFWPISSPAESAQAFLWGHSSPQTHSLEAHPTELTPGNESD